MKIKEVKVKSKVKVELKPVEKQVALICHHW